MDISGASITDIERCEIMHETINDQIRKWRSDPKMTAPAEDIILWSDDEEGAGEAIVRSVRGREFLVPRGGFFQANLSLIDRMVDEVFCLMPEAKPGVMVDACSGCGLFSVFAASYAARIIGVEISEKSVRFARVNACRRGVPHAEFICGDLEDVLCDMARKGDGSDAMILDPPRTGLSPAALSAIAALKVPDIIYISCNPARQATSSITFNRSTCFPRQSISKPSAGFECPCEVHAGKASKPKSFARGA
jgi:23S rRNA (uracil1939-C5)-methyltransferase